MSFSSAEVDHDAVVAGAEAGAVVAAAADGERQPCLVANAIARATSSASATRAISAGPAVDHRVVDRAGGFVVRVAGLDQPATEGVELLAGIDECAHGADATPAPRAVMTRPDPLSPPAARVPRQPEVIMSACDGASGPAVPAVGVPVRRAARASWTMLRSLVPWADGEDGASRSSAARRAPARAGSCGSSRSTVAERGALVLYGACDAVVHPPYGPFVEAFEQLERADRPSCGRVRATAASCALGRGRASPRATPKRHRLHTARRRPARGRRAGAAGRAGDRGRALGGQRRRSGCCATSRGPAADARARARHVPRGGAAGARWRRRSPTCAAPMTSSGCGSAGSPADEVEEFVRRAGGEAEELAARSTR